MFAYKDFLTLLGIYVTLILETKCVRSIRHTSVFESGMILANVVRINHFHVLKLLYVSVPCPLYVFVFHSSLFMKYFLGHASY